MKAIASGDEDSKKLYSGNGFNNGTLTVGQIKEIQAYYGVEADGKYGPQTKEATGGLTADEAYAKIFGGSGETGTGNKLTASEAKGVSSQVSEFANNDDLEGAEAYLTFLVSKGYLTKEEAMSFLAPYVTVEEDEVVDTTVPGTSTGSNANSLVKTNTGTDYPIYISPEDAAAFADASGLGTEAVNPADLMKLWQEKGQWTGLTFEEWVKTIVGTK
jgi:hypothetical protein